MPYHFKLGETTSKSFRRIVAEEIDETVAQLRGAESKKRDSAIHEARKSLKKLRALLRLFRCELGQQSYTRENVRLRDVGHKLSELRDTAAVIEVFDSLAQDYRSALDDKTIETVHKGLEQSKRSFEESTDVEAVIAKTVSTVASSRKRLTSLQLNRDGLQAILPGLQLAYRRGRKAMSRAEADPRPENLHEWRKRVKDYWYHTKLLEELWPDAMNSQEKSLRNLQNWLGDDHNLVVLEEKLSAHPEEFGSEGAVEPITALAESHRARQLQDALKLGHRIYHQRPKEIAREIAALWDIWQSEPQEPASKPADVATRKKPARTRTGSLPGSKTSAA